MEKSRIVLNHLVFAKGHNEGMLQLEMLKNVVKLGVQSAELRREYFEDIQSEIPVIADYAQLHGLRLFYSVPDEIFVNHRINSKLTQYYDEAAQLGVSVIKFNVGDFDTLLPQDIRQLTTLLAGNIETNIENDQTQTSGRIIAIKKFIVAAKAAKLDIGYVYDMGNWRYVGEDETVAAQELKSYVRYIHVKDDKGNGENLITVPLDEGDIDWRTILNILPQDVPVAIEYPTNSEQTIFDGLQALEESN